MSIRSAASIRAQINADQDKILRLLAARKKEEALKLQVEMAKNGVKGMMSLDYQGKKVKDVDEFKEAKRLTDKLFKQLWEEFGVPKIPNLIGLIQFSEEDFIISLFQAYDVAGVFNQHSAGLDGRLKTWFVLGFYASVYELGGKTLLSFVNVFPKKKPHTKVGEAVDVLKNRHKIVEISDYFDPFLRNSIDHSEYIVTDYASGEFDAWNTVDGVKKPKRRYDSASVFKMTVRLLFFIVAYHVSYYETVIKLDEMGAIR